jgi:hypothetical protein
MNRRRWKSLELFPDQIAILHSAGFRIADDARFHGAASTIDAKRRRRNSRLAIEQS